jgi:type VI secretion system protein ImpG
MCGEFSREHPKIASRLSLEGFVKEFQCPDPYVERLLEGFAWMAARVQLKVDADYPRFSQHLLDMIYPDYLSPTPSMGIVQFQPDLTEGSLNDGPTIPRQTVLRGLLGKDDQTPCEYRTAHPVTLWPIQITGARYLPTTAAVAARKVPSVGRVRAGLVLSLKTTTGVPFAKLGLDRLALYLRGNDEIAMRLYEQLLANRMGIVVGAKRDEEPRHGLPSARIAALGFGDDEALLPVGPRSFQGYRLLKEYFAFPDRFMVVEMTGLAEGLNRIGGDEADIFVLFDRSVTKPSLEEAIEPSRFAPFCTPVINLFPKRADRIHLTEQTNEYHIVPDRSRPMDFEVYGLRSVQGYGSGNEPERPFMPFYACTDRSLLKDRGAYYAQRREPRMLSSRQRLRGPRSSYIGSEVFVSLVDGDEVPFRSSMRQLALEVMCTNRDLPLRMPVGIGRTDLTWEVGAPLQSCRFLAGPTEPRQALADREVSWQLISHLALNYLSLANESPAEGASALREILGIYAAAGDATVRTQIEGVVSIAARPIHRRLPVPGPVTIGRGLELSLVLDEASFTGSGVFLLGSVLETFFARYVSTNSFTETIVSTPGRGEIMRWPARIGRRHRL